MLESEMTVTMTMLYESARYARKKGRGECGVKPSLVVKAEAMKGGLGEEENAEEKKSIDASVI